MSELKCIEHYTGIIRGRLKDIERNAREQDQTITALEAERDELKREIRVLDEQEVGVALDCCSRIPRVITTDELREGQVAVLMSGGSIDAGGSVMNVEHEGDCVFVDFSRPEETFQVMADHTIVLLADAPEPDHEVTAETIHNSEPDSIGGWPLTRSSLTPPEKPERRGEVLIDGTDYVPWEDLPKYAENHVKALREARQELKELHMTITELKHDPKPELPTEPGSVVLVTRWQGEVLDEPTLAFLENDGKTCWWRICEGNFPDGCDISYPKDITGFKNARIVVEDGA